MRPAAGLVSFTRLPISLFSLVTFIFLLCVQQTRNMSFLISTPRLGSERSARVHALAGPARLPRAGRNARVPLEVPGDVTDVGCGSRVRVRSGPRPWQRRRCALLAVP